MAWVIKVEQVIDGRIVGRNNIMTLERPAQLNNWDDLGLQLEDGKRLMRDIQALIVAHQTDRDNRIRRHCPCCGKRQRIKDYRLRSVDTLFGRVTLRRARYECNHCKHSEAAPEALHCRSTPEFNRLRAKLAAHVSYRVVRSILREFLPVSKGVAHTTIREHTFSIAQQIADRLPETTPTSAAESLTLGLDTAYIRARPGHPTRHVHVLVGEVLRDDGGHRYFANAENQSMQPSERVSERLKQLGYNDKKTVLNVFTDGEDGLCKIARAATGGRINPILDWFHIAMRLQHLRQLAKGLSTRVPTHAIATKKIQAELERLRWRLWHGRAHAVDESLIELVSSIRTLRKYRPKREALKAARAFWVTLHELKRYVRGNEHRIVNYHQRQCAGQRVSTSLVESAVNHIVNRRMNKSQQMRWSMKGAHRLLQVRVAVINGEFEELTQRSATIVTEEQCGLPLAA